MSHRSFTTSSSPLGARCPNGDIPSVYVYLLPVYFRGIAFGNKIPLGPKDLKPAGANKQCVALGAKVRPLVEEFTCLL